MTTCCFNFQEYNWECSHHYFGLIRIRNGEAKYPETLVNVFLGILLEGLSALLLSRQIRSNLTVDFYPTMAMHN